MSLAFMRRVWTWRAGIPQSISDVGRVCDFRGLCFFPAQVDGHLLAGNTGQRVYAGQATVELTPFKKIFGVDPSAGMVDTARRATASSSSVVRSHGPDWESGRITYVQSPAESLAFLADGSVDLMIAGMCIGPLRLSRSGSYWGAVCV